MTRAEKHAKANAKFEELLRALERERDPKVRRQIKSSLHYWGRRVSELS